MLLRRFTGVLTAACMIHLSVVASDGACATHAGGAHDMAGGMATASGSAEMDTMMSPDSAVGEKATSHQCETPIQPDCCRALASCSSTFSVTASTAGLPAIQRGEILQNVSEMPRSEMVAPATPPPKA